MSAIFKEDQSLLMMSLRNSLQCIPEFLVFKHLTKCIRDSSGLCGNHFPVALLRVPKLGFIVIVVVWRHELEETRIILLGSDKMLVVKHTPTVRLRHDTLR
jgi:hypothetical protein